MSAVHFPKDFALGAASAATQIDGDCKVVQKWKDKG